MASEAISVPVWQRLHQESAYRKQRKKLREDRKEQVLEKVRTDTPGRRASNSSVLDEAYHPHLVFHPPRFSLASPPSKIEQEFYERYKRSREKQARCSPRSRHRSPRSPKRPPGKHFLEIHEEHTSRQQLRNEEKSKKPVSPDSNRPSPFKPPSRKAVSKRFESLFKEASVRSAKLKRLQEEREKKEEEDIQRNLNLIHKMREGGAEQGAVKKKTQVDADKLYERLHCKHTAGSKSKAFVKGKKEKRPSFDPLNPDFFLRLYSDAQRRQARTEKKDSFVEKGEEALKNSELFEKLHYFAEIYSKKRAKLQAMRQKEVSDYLIANSVHLNSKTKLSKSESAKVFRRLSKGERVQFNSRRDFVKTFKNPKSRSISPSPPPKIKKNLSERQLQKAPFSKFFSGGKGSPLAPQEQGSYLEKYFLRQSLKGIMEEEELQDLRKEEPKLEREVGGGEEGGEPEGEPKRPGKVSFKDMLRGSSKKINMLAKLKSGLETAPKLDTLVKEGQRKEPPPSPGQDSQKKDKDESLSPPPPLSAIPSPKQKLLKSLKKLTLLRVVGGGGEKKELGLPEKKETSKVSSELAGKLQRGELQAPPSPPPPSGGEEAPPAEGCV